MVKAVNVSDSPDLKPALAWLQCLVREDEEGLQVLLKHDALEIIGGLSDLVFTFVEDVAPGDAGGHLDQMFKAYAVGQRGMNQ